MGAVRIQTADKNITVIHSPTINVLWSEKLQGCEKQIHQDILTLNCRFWQKYEST